MMGKKCVFVCAHVQYVGVCIGLDMLNEQEVHVRDEMTKEREGLWDTGRYRLSGFLLRWHHLGSD